jgi:ketosteroid isomerase-like protein
MAQQSASQQKALQTELVGLETRYWNAIKQRDGKTAASLSGESCLVAGAQGVMEMDRPSITKMLESANYTLNDFSIEDVRMNQVSDDVVALAYKVHEEMTVDGKPVTLDAFDTSVWMKRGDNWVCVVHTEAPAGDPLGRH